MTTSKTKVKGITGLPKPWDTAVLIISTYGLAVFLVLYYVMIMYPREIERYNGLQESVINLRSEVGQCVKISNKEKPKLTRDREKELEILFIDAVTNKVAPIIFEELENGIPHIENIERLSDELADKIRITMLNHAETIESLIQEIYDTHFTGYTKVAADPNGVVQSIADDAIHAWDNQTLKNVARHVELALKGSLWGVRSDDFQNKAGVIWSLENELTAYR